MGQGNGYSGVGVGGCWYKWMRKRNKVVQEIQEDSDNSKAGVTQDSIREAEPLGERYTIKDFPRELTFCDYGMWFYSLSKAS